MTWDIFLWNYFCVSCNEDVRLLGLKAPFHLHPAEGGILHVLPGPSSETPNHFVPRKRHLLVELGPLWLALRSVASPISQARELLDSKETQDKRPTVLSISIPKQMLAPGSVTMASLCSSSPALNLFSP